MSIKFWIGNPGSGKSTRLLKTLIGRAQAEEKRRFFVIVPEQFTMQTQRELTRLHPNGGIWNIDVLAFDRLANRVFSETGIREREILSETGKRFLLRNLISGKENELSGLCARIDRPGNLELVKSMLSELMLYGISPEDLKRNAEAFSENNASLARKCGELADLLGAFQEALSARYMTAEEVPDYLARAVDRTELLQGAVIAFDGFTGFTPVQMAALGKLMQLVSEMHVTATLPADAEIESPAKATDLFAMSRTMLQGLSAIAEKNGIAVLPPERVTKENGGHPGRFAKAADLRHLSEKLFVSRRPVYEEVPASIRLFAAPSVAEEAQEVARQIAALIRGRGDLRYRDIAVLTGDFARYENEIRQAFSLAEIPFFMDEKRKLIHNPFVEYLRAAMEVCTEDFSYDSIARLLTTGMSPLTKREADELIDYLPARGIRGRKKWQARFEFPRRNENPAALEELNRIREKLLAVLLPFAESFSGRGGTVRAKTEALYAFCTASQCEQKLHEGAAGHQAAGRNALAQEYRQIYAHVMRMLEKYVDLLGEEKISRGDYRDILEAGLVEERIGIIPPGADEVTFGDMERTRLTEPKVLFFIGMNEGVLPRVESAGGMLSGQERELLRANDLRLKPSPGESILNHRFYTYLALTRPSELLVMSYAALTAEGEILRPAYVLSQLRALFPKLETALPPAELKECIERPKPAFTRLALSYSEYIGRDPRPEELELARWYEGEEDYAQKMASLYRAADAKKPKDTIGRAVAQALYGRRLVHSPTRLERFSACAFAHYARYGLRLSEKEEYRFAGVDVGNVLHNALDLFTRRLQKEKRNWAELSDIERDDLADAAVREAALTYNANILCDSARNMYELERMSRILRTSVWALSEQLRAGDFVPLASELAFTADASEEALSFPLSDGTEMILTGRIDRLDVCRTDAVDYLKIMDYKTGTVPFDLNRVYHGLQMQLIIYLQAALSRMKRENVPIVPAGIFYYGVRDPIVDGSSGVETEEALRTAILKEMRAEGPLLNETDAIRHLDRTLAGDKKRSDVYRVTLNKDGSCSANSQVASAEEFRLLGSFTQKKARGIGEAIIAGGIAVSPYRYEQNKACDYCPYKSLCGFDRKIPGYRYRTINKKDNATIYQYMEEEMTGASTGTE